jgi:hypothetical protein
MSGALRRWARRGDVKSKIIAANSLGRSRLIDSLGERGANRPGLPDSLR